MHAVEGNRAAVGVRTRCNYRRALRDLVSAARSKADRVGTAVIGCRVRHRGRTHHAGSGVAGRRGHRESAIAGFDLIEHRVAIVAVGHRLARRDLHLPLSLIAVVGRAGGAQRERLRLRVEAAENIFAIAVGGIGQRHQAVLNLYSLGRDGAQVRIRQNSTVGLQSQIAQRLQLRLHLRQRIVLGVQIRLRTGRIGGVLLALRQGLVVIVHAARGRRILRGGGETQAARHLTLRLIDAGFQRTDRRQKLRLLETLCYAHVCSLLK